MKAKVKIKYLALSSGVLAVIFSIAAIERYFAGEIGMSAVGGAKMKPGALFFLFGAIILFVLAMLFKYILTYFKRN